MGFLFSHDEDNDDSQDDDPINYVAISDSIINSINKCCFTCEICDEPPEIHTNESGITIKQNCVKCIAGYNLLFETKDCYDNSIKEFGFYLSSNDLMYHKCDIQCKTCEDNIVSNEPNCTSCNYKKGYFPAENKLSSKCYNQSSIDKNYYLKEFSGFNNEIINKEWMLCYSSCDTCLGYGNSSFHNCSSCKEDNYFIYGTTNCITKKDASEKGFYFDSDNNTFYKCDIACSKCVKGYENNNTNCLECNLEENYYPLFEKESNCFNNETISDGFYLEQIDSKYKWKKCYERCEKCFSG